MQDEEFIQSFIEESRSHIETIENELLGIDVDELDMDSINTIFRSVHTIKGTSGFFDFKTIVKLSHALENLYGEIRADKINMTTDMVDLLLRSNDCLKVMIEDVMNSDQVNVTEFTKAVSTILENKGQPARLTQAQAKAQTKVETKAETKVETKAETTTATTTPVIPSVVGEENLPEEQSVTIEQSSPFFNFDQYMLKEDKKQLIHSEVKRGCRLYLLTRKMYGDIIRPNVNLMEIIDEITSMGSVIDMKLEIMSTPTTEDEKPDLMTEILFTTVLEKDFLPEILSVPDDQLIELLVNMDDSQMAEDSDAQQAGKQQATNEQMDIQQLATEQAKEQVEDALDGAREIAPTSHAASEVIVENAPIERTKDKPKGVPVTVEDNVRVSVTLLNNLLNLSSEMVLARNQLFRRMEDHRKKVPGIDVIFQNINHITTNLQETIMQTRMQPVSNVFSKFPRIARELSKKLEKDLVLELEGTDVELDKSIIEALGDPLTHLVRNAIDHGMELPDVRMNNGKPRTGTIKLKAYHESGYVNIDVIDDGKGINTEVIRRKALEKGFIHEADLESLGEQKSLQLLFKPGFSTAEAVTDLSGRGVGMDVVKTNIEKLGGKIEIFTVLGKGTTFRLLLPLTLAIIPSLIVEAERQKFALPQINVQEIVRIKANDPGRKIELINQAEVLRLRGRLLPIVRLSDVLGLHRTYLDPVTGEYKTDKRDRIFHLSRKAELMEKSEQQATTEDERRGYKLTNIVRIIVIKIGSRRMGLSVDTIFGSEEILVKTLPAHIKGCNNYSGVTILGDGKVAMILDPSGIIENANLRYIDNQFDMKSKLMISEAEKMRELQSLLLFKCSGPEILAIDMAMVSRVEEIQAEDINLIGDKEFIKFRGEPLRIIRPEDYISIQKQETVHTASSKYFVIIPKLVKYPMGILMEKVQDTIQASISLTGNDSLTSKGLVGSTILNDKIVLLVNIYELFELANPEQYVVEPAKQLRGPVKILLVEDTPFFQKLEKDYLENAGYDVTVADNGKIALQILQKSKFDLIVSDINMPEIDGLELVRRIRADSELCQLPVIAVTSLTGDQQKQEGLAAGFDAYEFKLDRSKLIEVLEETLHKKR